MAALIFFVSIIIMIGGGLAVNLYLYTHHAMPSKYDMVDLDEQLFSQYS